jgi:hypothetical protein
MYLGGSKAMAQDYNLVRTRGMQQTHKFLSVLVRYQYPVCGSCFRKPQCQNLDSRVKIRSTYLQLYAKNIFIQEAILQLKLLAFLWIC